MHEYFNPVRTFQGENTFKNIDYIIEKSINEITEILLIVWDDSVLEIEDVDLFIKKSAFKVNKIVFNKANPTIENLWELYENVKILNFNLIIAIGGGSVLDVGKVIGSIKNLNLKNSDELREIIDKKDFSEIKIPWVGVPTTAGTGSEVTCWATIWDVVKSKKLSVENEKNYALAAIIDPVFLKTMPKKLLISSALDALAHATESYWAKKTNPVTKALALYSINTIITELEGLCANTPNIKNLEALSKGSYIAGLAFSATKTTACHSISYPLTMHFALPHGVAVSQLIGPMIAFNNDYIENKEEFFNAFNATNGTEVKEKINRILLNSEISNRLKDWGIKEENLNFIVENAFTKGRIDNNPRVIEKEDVMCILKEIY